MPPLRFWEEVLEGQLQGTQEPTKMPSKPINSTPHNVTESGEVERSDLHYEMVEIRDRRRELIDEELRQRENEIKWREEEIESYKEENFRMVGELRTEETNGLDIAPGMKNPFHQSEDMEQLEEDVRRLREEMNLLQKLSHFNSAEMEQQPPSLKGLVLFVPSPENFSALARELNPVASPEYEAKWKPSVFPYVCIEVHNASCMICQLDFEVPPAAQEEEDDKQTVPELLRQFSCRHVFHRWCIDKRIRRSLEWYHCPVCRRYIDRELVAHLRPVGNKAPTNPLTDLVIAVITLPVVILLAIIFIFLIIRIIVFIVSLIIEVIIRVVFFIVSLLFEVITRVIVFIVSLIDWFKTTIIVIFFIIYWYQKMT